MPEGTDTQTQGTETSAPEWMNGISDEALRSDPNIAKYKTLDEFAKGHVNVAKLVGAKGVILPSDKATPEELNAFYNKLGRPESADKYTFKAPDKLHEGVKVTPEFNKGFAELVHSEGLTQKQADSLYNKYLSMWSKGQEEQEKVARETKAQAETSLRSEWGESFDKNLKDVNMMLEKFGGEGASKKFGDLGANPTALKTLANLAKNFSEDGVVDKGRTGAGTVQESQGVIDSLVKDSKSDYYSNDDVKRSAAIKKVQEAYKKLEGGK